MKRLLYFGYFVKKADYGQLKSSFKKTKEKFDLTYGKLFVDLIISSFRYGSSFHDYFMFEFHNKTHEEKNNYLTTARSYEFYTTMNEQKEIAKFRNKAKFNMLFEEFIKRDYLFLDDADEESFTNWIADKTHIIAKPNEGTTGKGIERLDVNDYSTFKELYSYLMKAGLNLVEEVIIQHPKLECLNPTSVNTLRIITVKSGDSVEIVGAILRIGINNHVDNFSAGGIAAPINISTGIVYKPAISKMNGLVYKEHPETNTKILGFKIPYWKETMEMALEATAIAPQVRTVGWDIAITAEGPELIEGNDNWNKDSFQLPYGKGRIHLLEKFRE